MSVRLWYAARPCLAGEALCRKAPGIRQCVAVLCVLCAMSILLCAAPGWADGWEGGPCSTCGGNGQYNCDNATNIFNCWHGESLPSCNNCGVCSNPRCACLGTVVRHGVCFPGNDGQGSRYSMRMRKWDCSGKPSPPPDNPCYTALGSINVDTATYDCGVLQGQQTGPGFSEPDEDPC